MWSFMVPHVGKNRESFGAVGVTSALTTEKGCCVLISFSASEDAVQKYLIVEHDCVCKPPREASLVAS